MYREIIDALIHWKNRENRKPLLLKGARQVGKTWILKEFGRTQFKKTAYVSFYNNSVMKRVFEPDYDVKRIITSLSVASGVEITPADTLIILDEIQDVPRAIEALKYFCENAPEYPIAAAGSLLGVAIHKGLSFPVGKVNTLELYPMSFCEFLRAQGEERLVALLKSKDYAAIDVFSEQLLFHLKNYFYVGGMPEAVDFFARHKDFTAVREIQSDILSHYRDDFSKHISSADLPRVNMVWDALPIQLAKENKKFFFGQVKKGARAADFERAIQWLVDAGLVHKVNKVTAPRSPLKFYCDQSAYKLFTVDVGLLGAMCEVKAQTLLEETAIFAEYKGAMTEQYVMQEIVSTLGITPYYYGTDSATFEQDFIVETEGKIIPIEVKAGRNVRSQSLKAFCDKFNMTTGVRFSQLPYVAHNWMRNIPLYAVSNLGTVENWRKEKKIPPNPIDIMGGDLVVYQSK